MADDNVTEVATQQPALMELTAAVSVAVRPRLAPDRNPGVAELWVLNDDAKLLTWLARADDRLVARLEVARITVVDTTKVVLLARGGRGGPPVLVLDADAYRPYLKLPNFFLPVGKKLVPPLRRDLAKRAFAPDGDRIVWLDERGSMTSLHFSAFRPLLDCVRYERPNVAAYLPLSATPVVTLDTYDAKERPAGERIKLAADETNQTGRLAMIWHQGEWRHMARAKP